MFVQLSQDLLLFLSVCGLFASRWLLFPQKTMQSFRDHPEQAAYLSTIAVSASTLVEITAMVLGRTWAGWETAVMVLWYCDVALSIVAALAPYWYASPAWAE